jgi:predicted dinucleotide-utilizing enzyme
MVGYGMIGENVCKAFSMCKHVAVYDTIFDQCLKAISNGFDASVNMDTVIPTSDVLISSTG